MQKSVRRNAEQWAALIDEFVEGNENDQQFCERHQLRLLTFRKWKYRYQAKRKQAYPSKPGQSALVEVQIRSQTIEPVRVQLDSGASIECANEAQIDLVVGLVRGLCHGR